MGNWKKSEYGLNLLEKYADLDHFYLLDPIYDKSILDVLRGNCYIYLHGHSAGGTNPSLVEAMNMELPIAAYDIGYNRETTEDEALFWKKPHQLLSILENLTEEQCVQVSNDMARIAKRRYTWKVIAEKYHKMMQQT